MPSHTSMHSDTYIHIYVRIHIYAYTFTHTNNHKHVSYNLPALPGTLPFPPGDLGGICNENAPRGFLPAVWLLKFVKVVGGMLKSELDDQVLWLEADRVKVWVVLKSLVQPCSHCHSSGHYGTSHIEGLQYLLRKINKPLNALSFKIKNNLLE